MGRRLNSPSDQNAALTAAFRILLDESQDGQAVISDDSGEVLFANRSLRRILNSDRIDAACLKASGLDIFEGTLSEEETVREVWLSGQIFSAQIRRRQSQPGDLILLTLSGPVSEGLLIDHIRAMRHSFAYRVIESMGQGLTVINSQGRFEYVNPAYARMIGYSREELIGKSPLDITLPQDHSMFEQAQLRRLNGETTIYDSHLLSKDGLIIDVLVTAVPLLQQNHPFGAITVVTNLADRRRVAEDLRQSSEAMRRMYEIISSGEMDFRAKIYALLNMGCELFDMQIAILAHIHEERLEILQCVDGGQSFLEGTSYPLNEVISKDVIEAEGPLAIQSITNSVWSGRPVALKHRIASYLGARVMVAGHVYGTLIFASRLPHEKPFASGELEFLRLMAQWIGGEIEREQYLKTLQDYASQIEQKSADLAEARDQALQAARVKSEFLAVMSHEIRTPLNAVIGMNELLLAAGLNAEQSEYSRVARDSAQALLTLIDDILDFSKIEAGKLTLEQARFELEPTVRSVVQMFTPRARQKGLELNLSLSPELPRFLIGDSLRLRQVLINLVGNAVKFTEKGQVCVRVASQAGGDNWIEVRCEVEDTGPGLSAEALQRVFEPFTQADGSTTRKYGGTGLGLSISQQLVEMMGGKLDAESREGQGARFWFSAFFQLAGETETAWSESNLGPQQKDDRHSTGSNLRKLVLLAEDNPANRRLAIAQLRRLGYEVEAVSTGRQVVSAIRRQSSRYALLLLDCRMPEMDGFDAARGVRQFEQLSGGRIPIVAMTANALEGDREACLAAGMDDYVTKPVTLEKLKGTLDRWLSPQEETDGKIPEDILDLQVVEKVRLLGEDGEDFLGDLISVYLDDSARLLERIIQAQQAGSPTEMREAVHALKGSSGSLGARRLSSVCLQLERLLDEHPEEGNLDLLAEQIRFEHQLAVDALQAVLRSSRNLTG